MGTQTSETEQKAAEPKKHRFLVSVLSIIFSVFLAKGIGYVIFHRQPDIESLLNKVVEEVKKKLPMAVDGQTALIDVAVGDKEFSYIYQLKNISSADISLSVIESEIGPKIRKSVCQGQEMAIYVKNGITISYVYRGKDDKLIGKISVSPSMCSQ